MENEENRGLIHKKASEGQLVTFCQFNLVTLSHYSVSLSYSWILRVFLEHFGIGERKAKEGKRKQRSSRERQDQIATIGFIAGINLHVYFH